MNPAPPNIKTSTKSINVSLITRSPHHTIKLTRIQIFKTDFRKLLILSIFWEWRIWRGEGARGYLVCVIMTHCVRKSICGSPLIKIFNETFHRCTIYINDKDISNAYFWKQKKSWMVVGFYFTEYLRKSNVFESSKGY